MKIGTVYIKATGKLFQTIESSRELDLSEYENEYGIIDGMHDLDTNYVSNGILLPKIECPATLDKTEFVANGIDYITVSNIPTDSELSLNYDKYLLSSSVFELACDMPGEFLITIESIPYLIKEFTVKAIPNEN